MTHHGPENRNFVIYTEAVNTGGVTGVIENIVRSLPPGVKVTLLLRSKPDLDRWSQSVTSANVETFPVALDNRGDVLGWVDVVGLIRLARMVRGAPLIHFHLHTPFSCLPAIVLSRLLGAGSLVTTEHYIAQMEFLRRRKRSAITRLIREFRIGILTTLKRFSLSYIDLTILVSKANLAYFISKFGERVRQRSEVIVNGIDARRFEVIPPDRGLLLRGLQRPESCSHILIVVAGLNNQKGHEYLIRAMPVILVHQPGALLLCVGDGNLRGSLEELAHALNISRSIVFTGNRDDIPALLACSDLFVLPSLFEGMPLSILEAMAAGKAVVATRVDGTTEVVEDGITGFLVDSRSSDQLAAKILELLADGELRRQFGVNGKSRVGRLYTREMMQAKYVALYHRYWQMRGE